jgi:hypothetical protein
MKVTGTVIIGLIMLAIVAIHDHIILFKMAPKAGTDIFQLVALCICAVILAGLWRNDTEPR